MVEPLNNYSKEEISTFWGIHYRKKLEKYDIWSCIVPGVFQLITHPSSVSTLLSGSNVSLYLFFSLLFNTYIWLVAGQEFISCLANKEFINLAVLEV